jgi:hypothetical protein
MGGMVKLHCNLGLPCDMASPAGCTPSRHMHTSPPGGQKRYTSQANVSCNELQQHRCTRMDLTESCHAQAGGFARPHQVRHL